MCGSRPRICVVPSASSGTAPRSDSRKAFGNSSVGTRRRMDVSAEHMVEQARERFQLQDYYGAIHLLEEVVAAGRAFADAHHVLGLSYSLVGQQDQALAQLDRALALNPHYIEALVHRAIVLNELGREAEADAAFRRAAQVGGEPREGFAAHVAAKLANQHAAPAGGSARGSLPGHAGSQRLPHAGGGARFRWGRRSAVGPSLESIRAEEAVVTRWVLLSVALGLACQPSAADHEELGDRAYAAGAYRDAFAEYELGLKAHPGSADLNAKAGAAALHVGDFASAVDAYVVLGARDGSRAGEAADGLERVARAALAANDRGDAAKGLAGLRAVAPTRPLGRYTRLAALDAADRGDTASAIVLLPGAIAAAGDARMADSLLFVYGMAAVRARDCATAVPAFEGVIRRQREPAVADRAREGLGLCSLVEGQQLLE